MKSWTDKGDKWVSGNEPRDITQNKQMIPFRKDEIEQFLLQTNVAHKLLSRIDVEYENKLHK